jgi:uroporphyrinogen decarboxylase
MGAGRLRELLAGALLDRPPVAAWRHFPVDDQDPVALAEVTLRFQEEYDWDLVKVTPAQTYLAELWGASSVYNADPLGTRDFISRPVTRPDQWGELSRALPAGWRSRLSGYIDALSAVRGAMPADSVVVSTVFSPLSIARYLARDELFLVSARTERAALEQFLDRAAEVVEVLIDRAAREAGTDGTYLSLFPAGATYFGLDEYVSLAGATDKRTLAVANDTGWFNVVHFHAAHPLLGAALEYPVQAVSWDCGRGGPSPNDVLRECPGRVLVGGIDQRGELLTGSPAEVRASVRRLLEVGVDGRPAPSTRLVVAPGCTVLQTTPRGNLRALRDSVEHLHPRDGHR